MPKPADHRFPLTDMGNAERFVAQFGDRLHYVKSHGLWLVWDGKRWAPDETSQIERLAKKTVRSIHKEAQETQDDADRRKAAFAWAIKSESRSRVLAMIDGARAELAPDREPIQRTAADFDADPWLLNVANGVLDLRTAVLGPHDRALRCRKIVNIAYDPEAECPRWMAFLHRVLGGHEELVTYLQMAVGYSLTGRADEQCLFFLHGHGANGKSTFLETLRALLGEYAAQADFNTLVERRGDGPRNDIARLERTRLVTASELGEGKRLNEELVKSLTGGETVTARFLNREFFEFKPEFKLWLAANHKPTIRGTDDGIWRRVRLIPFEVQIPERERIPERQMRAALDAELSGILAWAVGGALLWQQRGLWPPPQVAQATAAYRAESDVLGAWLEECAIISTDEIGHVPPADVQVKAPASLLYQNYRRWAETNGEFVLTQSMFGRRLAERGLPDAKLGTGNNRAKWRLGIRLSENALQSSGYAA